MISKEKSIWLANENFCQATSLASMKGAIWPQGDFFTFDFSRRAARSFDLARKFKCEQNALWPRWPLLRWSFELEMYQNY